MSTQKRLPKKANEIHPRSKPASKSNALIKRKLALVRNALASGDIDDHDLSKIILHASSILAFRTALRSPGKTNLVSSGYCFMATGDEKSGDLVDIVFNGDTVGSMTFDEAKKRYPACG